MDEKIIKKYCELIIKAGVNLYEDQCLSIGCGLGNSEFALRLARTAYENGAKYVDITYQSNLLTKYRIEKTMNLLNFDFVPNYPVSRGFEQISNDWAYIRIDNLEDMDSLSGVDSEKLSIITKRERENVKIVSNSISSSKIAWCIAAIPGPVWAEKIFGNSLNGECESKLWEKLIPVLKLDKTDPVKEWMTFAEKLQERSRILTGMKIDKLLFTGEGTNLEIGLNVNSVWRGGYVKASNGRNFIPNIPTEEVFTTPDFKRTNGKVKVTKPVKVMENILYGIWFEFKDGKVVDFGSDSGKDILERYFNTDEGASYLGEVALVDSSSEVLKSGLIFNSILYDENAACHIALGNGITACFSNKEELLNSDLLKKNGCNQSLVHTDFMIGSEKINVTGFDRKGNKTEIIKDGKFVI